MKILHIIDSLGLGGAQTVVKGVFENQKDNRNIFLFSLRRRNINIEIEHKNIIIFNSNRKYSLKSLFELRDLIKKEKIDILHCHLFKAQFFGWLLKIIYFPNIRLIQHEHGKIFRDVFYYNKFINFSQKKTDLFIAVSKATKNKLIENGKVKDNKINVLPNFVDLKKFNGDNITWNVESEKEKLGIKKDEFVIGFVGRLAKIKGCEYLIKVLPYLNFPYRVLIAGDGPERKSLEDLAEELKVRGKVIFLGYRKDTVFIYSLLNILVMSSLSEASPMSVLEAWAVDVPIVASNVNGLNEIIFNNKNGLLFEVKNSHDLSEKIELIYKDGKVRDKLIGNGLEDIKKYDFGNYINNLNKIYEDIK